MSTTAASPIGLPLAQRLPIEIVRLVIQEAAFGISKARIAMPACKRHHEPTCLWGLLAACRLWRAAALPVYSSTVSVFAKDDQRSLCCARNGLSAVKVCALGWQHHVLRVLILATSQSLVRGTSMETISAFCGMFERASHATVHLFGAHAAGGGHSGQMCVVNVVPLFETIGESLSSLRRVDFKASNVRFEAKSDIEIPDSTIPESAVRVCRAVKNMDLSSCPELVLLEETILALTTLVLDFFCSNVMHCTELVRQQAGNLESLHISNIKAGECLAIFVDMLGRQTVYSRLKRLYIDILGAYSDDSATEHGRHLLSQGLTTERPMFPVIEYINCGSFYPFADSIMWQGAEQTLKHLIIAADSFLIGWLFPAKTGSFSFPGPLAKCMQLQTLEVQIITRADISDIRTQDIQDRIISVAIEITRIKRVCLCYRNATVYMLEK